jgi:hypothetical protein
MFPPECPTFTEADILNQFPNFMDKGFIFAKKQGKERI